VRFAVGMTLTVVLSMTLGAAIAAGLIWAVYL
jgi:hypothetical protein